MQKRKSVDYTEAEIIAMLKRISFFQSKQSMKDVDYKDLVQGLSFEEHEENSVVFNLGDRGDKFFIILEGCVSVQIRN